MITASANQRAILLVRAREGGSRFVGLNTGLAGGRNGMHRQLWASTFDGMEPEAIKQAVAEAPWQWPDQTLLVFHGRSQGAWSIEEIRAATPVAA